VGSAGSGWANADLEARARAKTAERAERDMSQGVVSEREKKVDLLRFIYGLFTATVNNIRTQTTLQQFHGEPHHT
jgi:hypothetical protein